MEKKTGCRRRIVIKEDFIFVVGVCGHVTGAWWAPWGPGLSIFRFRRPWRCFLPVETCLEFNSKLGVVIYGHRPSQPGFQAGVEWADDPQPWRHVRVGSGQYGTYKQRWANKGQRTSQLSPPRTTYFLFWFGWFPNNGQRLTRIRNRTQEDVSTLWVRHWWCYTSMTGSGGFTPGTPVSTHIKR